MEVSNDAHTPIEPSPVAPAPAAAAPPPITRGPVIEESDMSQADYEKLLDQYDKVKSLAEGEVVRGRILKVLENEVIVDIGYKSEGVIPIEEFRDPSGQIRAEVGQEIEVLLEKAEDTDGYVVLSKEKAEKMKVWDEVERAYNEGRVVTGRVIERIKGGLAVDIGIRSFLPGSLVDVRPVRNLDALRGKEFRMKVIKVNKRRGNIVLSRKAVLEEENAARKKTTLEGLDEGKVVKGTVKNITEYGAFIDLGGIDGLLHITDMSWGRINHPSEMFSVGDDAEVVILKYDRERERVSLGFKQRMADPWERAAEKYPIYTRIRGKVVSLTDYGAFVELEEGIEGLIHVSEMSWTKRVKHPSKIVTVGDVVEAVVLDIDQEARRLSLGLKQTEPNPWDMIDQKYHVGDRIKGTVRNLTDFGAFVEVEDGIDGLVHVSDLTWDKKIKHPSDFLKKGDEVEAVILKIDTENQRLSLGIKQLGPSAYDNFFAVHGPGEILEGTIVRTADFGAFVELEEGVEGLVHISELSSARVEKVEDLFQPGQKVQVKILRLDPTERKIGLSIRAVTEAGDISPERYSSGSTMGGGGTINIGDFAQDLRGDKKKRRKDKVQDEDDSEEEYED
jgi:small subunit ribosomal protein S1